MFNNLNPITTGILGLGMEAQRQGIPEEERCWNCDGRGSKCKLHINTRNLYNLLSLQWYRQAQQIPRKTSKRAGKIKETKIGAQ